MNELELVEDLKFIAGMHNGIDDSSNTGKLMLEACKSIENSARIILNYRKIEEKQDAQIKELIAEVKALNAHNIVMSLNIKRYQTMLRLHKLPVKPFGTKESPDYSLPVRHKKTIRT